MLMYMFNPDHVGDAVRDALVAARGAGSRSAADRRLRIGRAGRIISTTLNRAGGEHCVFNPTYGRRYLLRNHQKLIADRRSSVAIIGGANIDDSYMTDRGPKHWRDLVAAARRAGSRGGQPLFRYIVSLGHEAATRGCDTLRRMVRI